MDLWWLRQLPIPELVRHIRTSIPVGVWTDVELQLRNRSEYVLNLAVHDHHLSDFSVQDQLQSIAIPPQRQMNLRYRVLPNRRGER